MMRMVRQSALVGVAAALALALVPWLAGHGYAAPTVQGQARIAVAVFPDLAGDGAGDEGCAGCDGEYTAEDTAANATDPLPALEVVVRDPDGTEIARNTTSGLANGRQVTFFSVDSAGDYTVEITGVPEDWAVCPDSDLTVDLEAGDFDDTTGFASVDVFVWRGCEADIGAPTDEGVDEEESEAATEEVVEEEATEAVMETDVMTATEGMTETVEVETEEPAVEPADEEPATDEAATEEPEEAEPEEAEPEAVEPEAEEPSTIEMMGAIRGVVFEDANENGRLDAGEYGVPDASLRLVGLDSSDSTTSAGAGTYAFADLAPGSYDVYLDTISGVEMTTPDRYVGITIDGGVVMGMDFGVKMVTGEVAPTTVTPEEEAPALPSTGVQLQPRGRSLVALAVAFGVLGALGLALETRRGRRSLDTGKGGEDA